MGIGASIFLLAIGAILAFAVNTTISGLDIHVVGYILMGAGLIGLLLFLVVFNRGRGPRTATYVEDRPLPRDRDVY